MLEILTTPYLLRALIALFLISINAALSGSFTVFRGQSFLVAGAAHAALAGAALAIVLEVYGVLSMNPLMGGLIFAVLMAISAGYASREGKSERSETAIGVAFAVSMSLAILFISVIPEYSSRAWGLLMGDLMLLTEQDILLMLLATIAVIAFFVLFYREFLFISFDMEGAIAYGVNASRYNYLLTILIATSVVVILKGVGAILVYAMLIAPAAAANEGGRSINSVIAITFLIALLSGLAGIVVSFAFPLSPGAIAGLIAGSVYFIKIIKRG
ncbi:MAG: metal ABC transporter permease [Thermoplasmata archaeon]|nr:metal ABC transporter permease [Thermoplasmata archaeon]